MVRRLRLCEDETPVNMRKQVRIFVDKIKNLSVSQFNRDLKGNVTTSKLSNNTFETVLVPKWESYPSFKIAISITEDPWSHTYASEFSLEARTPEGRRKDRSSERFEADRLDELLNLLYDYISNWMETYVDVWDI